MRKRGEENLTTHFPSVLLPKALISFPSITIGFMKTLKNIRNNTRQEIKGGKGQEGGEKWETRRIIKRKEHSTQVYSGFSQELTVEVSFPP